jgi:hypothetical protein
MQRYTVYLYLKTALRVSGGTSTHHQEKIQLYLQHLVFVTPLLLPAAIVEELETGLSVLWVAYSWIMLLPLYKLWHGSCYFLYINFGMDHATSSI